MNSNDIQTPESLLIGITRLCILILRAIFEGVMASNPTRSHVAIEEATDTDLVYSG